LHLKGKPVYRFALIAKRKVWAAKSTVLLNGKAHPRMWQKVPQKGRLPKTQVVGKGEKVG